MSNSRIQMTLHRLTLLAGGAAFATLQGVVAMAQTDDCRAIEGSSPPVCAAPNRTTVVDVPAGENTEFDRNVAAAAPAGFVISVDGKTVGGDERMADRIRQADKALEAADIQVTFDGLSVRPRLDLEIVGPEKAFKVGDSVVLQSAMNYPSYVTRGEMRLIDRAANGGPRVISVSPLAPNGTANLTLPEGKDMVVVYRVYDSFGRFDETVPITLSRRDGRGLTDGVEEGNDATATRNIPVSGGSVTVYGKNLAAGAKVQTLGETVMPAPQGDFVLQRILPVGTHAVDVLVQSPSESFKISRDIEIPRSDWFYVGSADLTLGWHEVGGVNQDYQRGRVGFYVIGKTAEGLNITATADTGEGDLDTIFRDLDKKDPRSLILRIDPDDYYPVYGDDSTFEETAPTSGRFYLKVEKDGNYGLWGNFKNSFRGTEYLRSERTLYGFQGHWASKSQTSKGEPRAGLTVYGANPENLPQRDIFRGTGGSIYFLQQQDISIGSENLSVEIRDATTGRVVSRQSLIYGRDYDINYIQGVVSLSRPLSGSTGGGLVSGTTNQVFLVAQYEWTPTALSVSGLSYGARGEVWATDNLRFGVTGQRDEGGSADQKAIGADLRWELSDETYVQIEAARSDGPGYGSNISIDGGLLFNSNPLIAGSGQALKFEGRASLADLGFAAKGYFGAYAENRDAGFSTLDYQVAQDEKLRGVYAEIEPTDRLKYSLKYDDYQSQSGKVEKTGTAEIGWKSSERLSYRLGVEHTDKVTTTQTGNRTDVALRATFSENSALEWYVFGQTTVSHSRLPRNDRVGVGAEIEMRDGWAIEVELSSGNSGTGGKALFTKEYAAGESLYFGYELDPDREFDGLALTGRDGGKYTFGARRKLTDTLSTWGENTYDLFGLRRSLTSAYGVEYTPDTHLSYTGAIEYGDVTDAIAGDFTRYGLSLGARYQDSERLAASGKLELRRDVGQGGSVSRNADTIVFKSTARYKLNEAERLSFNLNAAKTTTANNVVTGGELADMSVGYALRPVSNDRLNLLFKYRFVYDMYGQKLDGTDIPGPRQRSHVLSVDADYDLNRYWSLGGKIGVRLADSAASATAPLVPNDAWLAVANARYHIVHKWDGLLEVRSLHQVQSSTTDIGFLGAVYRQIGNNAEIGLGYNFGRFSDDLTDLTQDDKGLFLNIIAKF
jgi:hypothetical protein